MPMLGTYLNPIAMAAAIIGRVMEIDKTSRIDLIDAHYFYPDGVAAAIVAKATQTADTLGLSYRGRPCAAAGTWWPSHESNWHPCYPTDNSGEASAETFLLDFAR